MKQQDDLKEKTYAAVLVFSFVVIIVIVSIIASVMSQRPSVVSEPENNIAFSFDSLAAPGWWTSGSTKSTAALPDDYAGDAKRLPGATITIMQGRPEKPGACFVSFYYKNSALDEDSAVSSMKNQTIIGDKSLTLQDAGAAAASITTPDGAVDYKVQKYTINGSSATTMARGVQFGYAPLKEGFVETRSYCQTADQLKDTLPVLAAVRVE